MIPKNVIRNTELSVTTQPSRTQQVNNSAVGGYCDHLEAMKQLIYQILNTKRYEHIIYSWNYGLEIEDLYGEPISYVCPELERRIIEALTQDERIQSVEAFVFDTSVRNQINMSFTVKTIFGETTAGKEVTI